MKLIDISHTLGNNTPLYPGDDNISIIKKKILEKDFYTAYYIESGFHTGTHIDLPMHLLDDNRTASDFPLEHFAGQGILLDVRGENIIPMKSEYERITFENKIVLFYTGFDKYYYEKCYFYNYPYISMELAEFLVAEKIKMVGFDTPAPDYPPFSAHKLFLSHNIFILENLTNLNSLSEAENFEVIAFPLKIAAEASFVRAVCKIL